MEHPVVTHIRIHDTHLFHLLCMWWLIALWDLIQQAFFYTLLRDHTDKTASLTYTQIGPLYYHHPLANTYNIIDRLSDLLGNKQKNISPPRVWSFGPFVILHSVVLIEYQCVDDKDARNVSICICVVNVFFIHYILRILTVKRFTSGKIYQYIIYLYNSAFFNHLGQD